jgi:predicted esterase
MRFWLFFLALGACTPANVEDDDSGQGGSSTSTSTSTIASTSTSTSASVGVGGAGGGATTGVDPSNGMGGTIAPGQTGTTPLGAVIRIPVGYDPANYASPVVWLFNEELPQWSAIADGDRIVLVDLDEYNDTTAIVNKLNESATVVETEYNVDKARYYWAGWSAGGNIAIILGSQNQAFLAGTLVFPGTGGNIAKPYMEQNTGHKMRLYYACGDQDPNFDWQAVQYEANFWQSIGYTTRFDKVVGAPHYLDESLYGVRAAGWDWIKGFHLQN